jgi:hypothetical protein
MSTDPTIALPAVDLLHADLELLLAGSDGEDRFLTAPAGHTAAGAPREALDEQILAGLVTP